MSSSGLELLEESLSQIDKELAQENGEEQTPPPPQQQQEEQHQQQQQQGRSRWLLRSHSLRSSPPTVPQPAPSSPAPAGPLNQAGNRPGPSRMGIPPAARLGAKRGRGQAQRQGQGQAQRQGQGQGCGRGRKGKAKAARQQSPRQQSPPGSPTPAHHTTNNTPCPSCNKQPVLNVSHHFTIPQIYILKI